MLYIKTTQAAKRIHANLAEAEYIDAGKVGLGPPESAYRIFLIDWNDSRIFTRSDISDNGRRVNYEFLREAAMKRLSESKITQHTILHIIENETQGRTTILAVKDARKFENSWRRLLVELFWNAGIRNIETDAGIDPSTVRNMDALSKNPQENTLIRYRIPNETIEFIVTGKASQDQMQQILRTCAHDEQNGLAFVPAALGLQTSKNKAEPWGYFANDSEKVFQIVQKPSTAGLHIENLVNLFTKLGPFWDALAKQRRDGYM